MKNNIFAKGTLLGAVCFLVGCAQNIAIRPGASGAVIDATTHQPISGAAVALEGPLKWAKGEYTSSKTTGHIQTLSGADGKFLIDPLMVWGFRSADSSSLLTTRVTVQKQGYLSEHVMFTTDKSSDLGTIALKRRQ